MKMVLGALAAVMLIGAVAVQPAEARCWPTPGGMECWHPHPHYWGGGWHRWHHDHWW